MFEEGKGGGAQRQRIDLLFVSRLVYYNYYCAMLHLINANTIVAMVVKFACVNSFIITFALRPDGYGQMQHPLDDVVAWSFFFLYHEFNEYNIDTFMYLLVILRIIDND
jgi:hypothetical protein